MNSSFDQCSSIPCDVVEKLLNGIAQIASASHAISDRRQATLDLLMEVLQARLGLWSWGFGDIAGTSIQPMAMITSGYTSHEIGIFTAMAMAPESVRTFRIPVLEMLNGSNQITVTRRMIFPDRVWPESQFRNYMLQMKVDEWMQTVRYETKEKWSGMFFSRNEDAPEFETFHRELLDVTMRSIPWLHVAADNHCDSSRILDLTDRQKTVMLLLLNGHSRKQIGSQLHITEDTVSDHIKSIYQHFDINSATELAAIFLRNQ